MDKAALTLPHAGSDSVFSHSANAAEEDGLGVGGLQYYSSMANTVEMTCRDEMCSILSFIKTHQSVTIQKTLL